MDSRNARYYRPCESHSRARNSFAYRCPEKEIFGVTDPRITLFGLRKMRPPELTRSG